MSKVNFTVAMPDGTTREVCIHWAEGVSAKQAQVLAVKKLSPEDRALLKGRVPQMYARPVGNKTLLFGTLMDWMKEEGLDSFEILEVDKETNKPIVMYTINKKIL